MSRKVNKNDVNYLANSLKESSSRMEYFGDLSDLGNEIGIVIGRLFSKMNDEEINALIHGIKHGISLSNRPVQ
jgi:hypothetical protein